MFPSVCKMMTFWRNHKGAIVFSSGSVFSIIAYAGYKRQSNVKAYQMELMEKGRE